MPPNDNDRDIKPDNVIVFPTVKQMEEMGGPVSRKYRTYKPDECTHRSRGVYVCRDTRKVTCKKCGTELDPIEALSELAQHWDWEAARDAKRAAEAEAKRLTDEVERIKAQRSRLSKTGTVSADAVSKALAKAVANIRAFAKGKCTPDERNAYSHVASLLEDMRLKLLRGGLSQETLDV